MASSPFTSIGSSPTPLVDSTTLPVGRNSLTAPQLIGYKKVPVNEKAHIRKNAQLFDIALKYELGDIAEADTFDNARGLSRKVKTVIAKYAINCDGKISKRWNRMSSQQRSLMVKALHAAVPWLKSFEDDWASEWLLSKGVNQRVTDCSRASYKQKEKERFDRLAKKIREKTSQTG
jgi:hypothetical protein